MCMLYIVPNILLWYNYHEIICERRLTMPASKAQQKAVSKYMKANYDEIKIRVPKGEREKIKAYAEAHDGSVNAFLYRLIREEMEHNAGTPVLKTEVATKSSTNT